MAPPRRRAEPRSKGTAVPGPRTSDPLASFKVWGVEVLVRHRGDTHVVKIPPRPAVDWITAVLDDGLVDLFDGPSSELLTDLHLDGVDIDPVVLDALTEVSGRPWYVALRLLMGLNGDDMRGEVLSRIDIATAPLGAVLDVIYALATRGMDNEGRTRFEAQLSAEVAMVNGDPRDRAQQMRQLSRERAQAAGMRSVETPPTGPRWPPRHPRGERSSVPTPPPSGSPGPGPGR